MVGLQGSIAQHLAQKQIHKEAVSTGLSTSTKPTASVIPVVKQDSTPSTSNAENLTNTDHLTGDKSNISDVEQLDTKGNGPVLNCNLPNGEIQCANRNKNDDSFMDVDRSRSDSPIIIDEEEPCISSKQTINSKHDLPNRIGQASSRTNASLLNSNVRTSVSGATSLLPPRISQSSKPGNNLSAASSISSGT